MNICRIAAVALMGWLLLAPWKSLEYSNYDKAMGPSIAESSRWATLASFDTMSACKDALAQRQARALKSASHPVASDPDRLYDMRNATCIASNDPRLNGR